MALYDDTYIYIYIYTFFKEKNQRPVILGL